VDHSTGDTPLVVHVLYRFECGGSQTVLAECIKHMPLERYRHAVVCLTDYTDYADSIRAAGVTLHALHKPPGQGLGTHVRLWKLLRRLRPAIVHTYNIGTIEYNLTALLAGVPVRIHAEHGRDSVEIDGLHRKYNLLRRLLSPLIDAFVPVSDDLVDWLRLVVEIPPCKVRMIPNGVDTGRYAPAPDVHAARPQRICIGTVGRADRIKNHVVLLDAFRLLLERFPAQSCDLHLAIVGDGPLLQTLRDRVAIDGWGERVWLPGARADVADIMRTFSIFVLPSVSEAMPVTILEAMATALPVVASRVGGIPRLVQDGKTGVLVQPDDALALAEALSLYISDAVRRSAHGIAGRVHVEDSCSINAMASAYAALYDECSRNKAPAGRLGVDASVAHRTSSTPSEPV
jgi:sugar transferase (PEP-CTERM/EpsH1 system associated)